MQFNIEFNSGICIVTIYDMRCVSMRRHQGKMWWCLVVLACSWMGCVNAELVEATQLDLSAFLGRVTLCPSGMTSGPGGESIGDCVCEAGRYAPVVDGPCELCPANFFKAAAGNTTCEVCGSGRVSLPGSRDAASCVCDVGFGLDGASGSVCVPCAAGMFKSFVADAPCVSCPDHSTSGVGARVHTACLCDPGFTGADGGPCDACAAGEFKVDPGSAPCSTCPDNSESPEGATSAAACECSAGFTLGGSGCEPCAADTFKDAVGDGACSPCVSNSVSAEGATSAAQCVCDEGHTGADGGPCLACAAGKFKAVSGSGECSNCTPLSTSPAASTSDAACVCVPGAFGTFGGCTQCPADHYCAGGTAKEQCPESSTAPAGSAVEEACVCVSGFRKEGEV